VSIPGLYTNSRIRTHGRTWVERKVSKRPEPSASWPEISSAEGLPGKKICGGILCI